MNAKETENDEAIARAMGQEDEWPDVSGLISKTTDPPADNDADLAFILQIEEIVKSERKSNKGTSDELEKTHSAITNALQTTEETTFISRMVVLFMQIKTRYTECVTKNQDLINQIQQIAIKTLPILLTFKTKGVPPQVAGALVAVGLASNFMNGNLSFDEVQQIWQGFVQLKNESTTWLELFEQVTYIFVAVTVPSLAQMAMGRVMQSVNIAK